MTKNNLKIWLVLSLLFVLGTNGMMGETTQDSAIIMGEFNFDPLTDKVKVLGVEEGEMKEYASTKINEKGEFGFMLPISASGFYYIDYGQMSRNKKTRQLIRLYLEKGQNIKLSIDPEDYTIAGEAVGHNPLVKKANKLVNKFYRYNSLGGNITYEQFYPFLEKEGIPMYNDLIKSINTDNQEFNELMKLAITADFESNLFWFFRLPRSKFPSKDNRPAIYQEVTQEIKFSDKNILKLGNGLDWMDQYFFYQFVQEGLKDRLGKLARDIEHIEGDQLKDVYIRKSLIGSKFEPVEYKKVIEPLYPYLTSEKSKDFLVEFEKDLHAEEGQPGFPFTYDDNNGNAVSFSDFKGKYLYVDVWATWCGPCLNEIPHLKKIEEEFEGEDIVFMSLSVDEPEDKQKWLDMIEEKELGGVQLMADKAFKSDFAKNYEINAIPRFLLFDREGNIISTDALRPSNALLKEQFEDLLKN